MENSNIKRNMKNVKDLEYIFVYLPTEQYTYRGETVADFEIRYHDSGFNVLTVLTIEGITSQYFNCTFEIQRSNQKSISHVDNNILQTLIKSHIGDINTDGK